MHIEKKHISLCTGLFLAISCSYIYAASSSSDTSDQFKLICTIKDLEENQKLPNNTAKQKKLFEWLCHTLDFQDKFVNSHYQLLLFHERRIALQQELDQLLANISKSNIYSQTKTQKKEFNRYLNLSDGPPSKKASNDLEEIVNKYASTSNRSSPILTYLNKKLEIEKFDLFRVNKVNNDVAENLEKFNQRLNTKYKKYLY